MSSNGEMQHIRSGGRQIELYAELGSYFSPDGRLNEAGFKSFVRETLRQKIAGQDQQKPSSKESPNAASAWLSSYLHSVLAYLQERGLQGVTLRLFELAMQEASELGVENLAIDPSQMQKLLSFASATGDASPSTARDPDNKKKKIFAAAIRVFADRGFHAATMDEIAAASGVGKGTLYRHFKSKEELLNLLLAETSDEIIATLSTIFSGRKPVLQEIQAFIEHWVGFIEDNHVLYRLIQSEGMHARPGKQMMFYERLLSGLPMLKEHVASMNRDRTLKLTSFYTVAYGMLGFIDGVVHRWFSSGMDYSLRDEIPIILEVLFNGFVGERGDGTIYFVPPEDRLDKEA